LETPVRIIGEKGRAVAALLQRQELGPKNASGRPRPIPTSEPPIQLRADHVIAAIGTMIEADLFPELARRTDSGFAVSDAGASSVSRIFIGGDAVNGEGTIVAAFADGRRIGEHIAEFLRRT
jgi:NADPH-dependent glutamate synthase beta subunit-like oxidoreductase